MHKKHNKKATMEWIQDKNDLFLGPRKSHISADVVQKRIKHQMQRELREYEKGWEFQRKMLDF